MTKPLEVWVVDDDASIRWVLERALRQGGLLPTTFDHADAALTEELAGRLEHFWADGKRVVQAIILFRGAHQRLFALAQQY